MEEVAAALASQTVTCWACGGAARPAADLRLYSIYECASCGFGLQPDRRIDVSQLYGTDYFATYQGGRPYARNDPERRLEARARLKFVRRFVRDGRLLEIGAAAGHFVAEASRAGFAAIGVEPNAEMVRFGREQLEADMRVGRAEEAGSLVRDVDVLCAWHVLEHLASPKETLEQLRVVMRTEGLIFLEVPNFASVRAKRDRARWQHLHPIHHVSQYTPDAIRALLRRTGFEPLDVVTVPWAEYLRWPRSLVSYGKQALVVGRSTLRTDPWKHELLRVVAQRKPDRKG